MEGQYYKFYGSNCPWTRNEITDIDEMLNAYLMPIQDIEKSEYLATKFSTNTSVHTAGEPSITEARSPKQPQTQQNSHENVIQIQFSSEKVKERQEKQKKLQSNQTLNLNAYFHQEMGNYLSQLIHTKAFNKKEEELIKKYCKASKSFNSHLQLLQTENIKSCCMLYLKSPDFISRILTSNKMSFSRKKNVVKYVQKFYMNLANSEQTRRWRG